MALYSLTYDLVKQRNYQKLYDELGQMGAIRVTESQWYFNRINATCQGLRDYFLNFVDGDDRIMVAEVTVWAGRNLLGDPNKL